MSRTLLDKSKNEKKFFNKFVKTNHSQVPREAFWKAYSENYVFESIKRFSELAAYNRILEIGCGTCYYFSAFSSFKNEPFVIGADISVESLKKCNRNFKNFSFVLCSANHLPFIPNIFDGILMISLLHHVSDYKLTLLELMQTVKLGGHLLIIDLTSTNLLINFARKIWFLLPHNFKDKIGDMQLDYDAPKKHAISQKKLIQYSEKIGAGIIRIEYLHLFVFTFNYLIKLIPSLSRIFSKKFLLSMYHLEKKLSRGILGAFCHVEVFFLKKQALN